VTQTDVNAVETVNAEFYAAFESADLDRMGLVWADGPHADDVVCVHPGWPLLRGRGTVLRSWALIMANTPYIQFFLTDVEVSVIEDVASVTCTENVLTGDETTGPDAFGGAKAVATNVFVRTSGGWRLWIHHASPVLSSGHHDDA
jgi:ketosteroid isomerase-like protein